MLYSHPNTTLSTWWQHSPLNLWLCSITYLWHCSHISCVPSECVMWYRLCLGCIRQEEEWEKGIVRRRKSPPAVRLGFPRLIPDRLHSAVSCWLTSWMGLFEWTELHFLIKRVCLAADLWKPGINIEWGSPAGYWALGPRGINRCFMRREGWVAIRGRATCIPNGALFPT